MKIPNSSARKGILGLAGLILLSSAVGVGSTIAATFEHGGSTTTIEQSGSGASSSEVTRYQDGQKIVTRDGSSTDVTIQGGSGAPASESGWGHANWADDRFDRQAFDERFPSDDANDSDLTPPSQREALKQRMLERMRSRF
jgi:hypothetical protein